MSDNHRTSGRVQGAWSANHTVKSLKPTSSLEQTEKANLSNPWPCGASTVVDCPADQSSNKGKSNSEYKFEQPCENDIPKDSQLQTILKPGIYEISCQPSGVSRLRLFQFYANDEADIIFNELMDAVPWMEMTSNRNGIKAVQPRLMAWFGELPYTYSGITHPATSEWPALLLSIRQRLEDNTGLTFNSVLCNLYRTGKDHVAWHSDDEPALGENPVVASFSFGDVRSFELRKKPVSSAVVGSCPVYSEFIRMPLTSGSLLVMEGCTQADWQHRVPAEYHDRKSRINLTFRNIYEEPTK